MREPRTNQRQILTAIALICLPTAAALSARAQPPQAQPAAASVPAADNTDALRKQAQNPVASLISVPLQDNWNFNIGPADRTQNVLNVQPVIPLSLTENWNLIIRWIAPIIYQPVDVPQAAGPAVEAGYYGLGDMQPAFFLSPKKSKVIWGIGPQLLLPTATKTGILGQGKFGVGPTIVVLVQPGKWTLGVLTNNVWGIAGHSDLPDVNQFLLQYFINYNLKKGYYITWQPTLTANWEADERREMGGTCGRRHRTNHAPGSPAGECRISVLRQCGPSARRLSLDDAAANRVSVPNGAELTSIK